MAELSSTKEEESLLKCIFFDQDAFLDLKRITAEIRRAEWETYRTEVSECSRSEILYSRKDLHEELTTKIAKHDMEIVDRLKVSDIILLGSSQDGLYLEKGFPIIDMDRGEVDQTDMDIAFEFQGVEIEQSFPEKANSPYLVIEQGRFPGYVLLRTCPCHPTDSPTYFNPLVLKRRLMIALDNANFFVNRNTFPMLPDGPALGGCFEDEFGICFLDYVPLLNMQAWPDNVNSFICRERKHGWPPKTLIEEIEKKGCGFVGVGHAPSSKAHLEWRISFAAAEIKLAHSLTKVQIRAYLFFKSIFKLLLSNDEDEEDNDCLSSYMMKNILFWVLEENSPDIWSEDNMLECVEVLVDKLTYCLEICYIPNYFIPDLNLIAHKNKTLVKQSYRKCYDIQGDVLGTIIQCTQLDDFKGECDLDLSKLHVRSKCQSSIAGNTYKIFSVVFYLMYLNIRLLSRRYQIKFGIRTIKTCADKHCSSLFEHVPSRAAWYIIEAIKHLPDFAKVSLYQCDDHFILDLSYLCTEAARFIKTDLYKGIFKEVVKDQEFVTNEPMSELPPFKTIIDWVDMTSLWKGGKALNVENIFQVNLD